MTRNAMHRYVRAMHRHVRAIAPADTQVHACIVWVVNVSSHLFLTHVCLLQIA